MSFRVRIAPSPTGDPHVGTAYIALFNYVWAKKHGGQFILRIEDTDQSRSRPEWEQMILDSLRWTGVEWDEGPDVGGDYGPYRQSERREIYREHALQLVEKGAAYYAFDTPERLAQLRKEQMQRGVAPGYDGRWRDRDEKDVKEMLDRGEPYVIRLKTPNEGKTSFVDELRGEITIENVQVDDQILLKSDGFPTYHLANIVDDHLMKVTHVIRAEEWISSVPKHVMLYDAFGWEKPKFIHMPLLRNADKSKISKRKNPVSINYYRQAGYLPEALLNYLAMMGWTMPDAREKFTLEEMVENFDFDRMSLGGPVFDVQKLTWLNGLYIREQGAEALVKKLRDEIFTEERLRELVPLVYERIDKLDDFIDHTAFFFNGDVPYDEDATTNLIPKKREKKEIVKALQAVVEKIDALPELTLENMETTLRGLCDEIEWKPKELFMPVRVAVTGRKATPPLFETMAALGKERCRRRLRNAIEHLKRVQN